MTGGVSTKAPLTVRSQLCLERPILKLAVAGMQLLTVTVLVFNTEEWPTNQGSKVCVSVWPLSHDKGKAIPVHAWTGPESSRKLKLSDFMSNGTWRW
jgi:hypothetical protein